MLYKRKRRDCSNPFRKIVVPDQCTNVRSLLDNVAAGKPVNTSIRKREPLPPDGMNPEDFETGTREILDLTDVQAIKEEYDAMMAEHAKKTQQAADEQRKTEFEKAVADEVAKKIAEQQATNSAL